MPFTLYMLDGSPPSWAVRVLADILGLDVESKTIDFQSSEHKSPEFRKMNPMGTIPVLKDGDLAIPESHSIMKYLLTKYGEGLRDTLYPEDPVKRALVDQVMFFNAGVAFIKIKLYALPAIFGGATELRPGLVEEIQEVYGIAEDYLSRNVWVAGENFTIADLSLGTTVTALNATVPVDAAKFPLVSSWLDKLAANPHFKKTAVPGAKLLAGFVQQMWKKNKSQ